MPVPVSRYELLEKRLRRFTRMLHGVADGNPRALHRTRVASRRLRELLPVLQLEGKVAAELGRRLRKVTQRLGKIRELDVTLQLLKELQDARHHDREALDAVASAVSHERERVCERVLAKWPGRDVRRVGYKLSELADELEDADASRRSRAATRGLRWAVDARIHRRAAELRAAIEDAGALYLPDRLHAVRISLKKYRYAVELGSEIAGDRKLGAQLRMLKRNQNLLGRWHDRQVLIDCVRQLQASSMPPSVGLWRRLNALVTMLENDCRRLHARYTREAAAIVAACNRIGVRAPGSARRASSLGVA